MTKFSMRRYALAGGIMFLIWVLLLIILTLDLGSDSALMVTGAMLSSFGTIIGFFYGKGG